MLKWKILAFIGLMFGVAGVVWGYAQQKKAIGFFELRVYTAQPGKRDALAARFADRTAAIYARHGITNVGYWIPQQSDPELGVSGENTFIYMRGYPSKEERDRLQRQRWACHQRANVSALRHRRDGSGGSYIVGCGVQRISPDGQTTPVTSSDISGENRPENNEAAMNATLGSSSIAVNAAGNLYTADQIDQSIWVVNPSGRIGSKYVDLNSHPAGHGCRRKRLCHRGWITAFTMFQPGSVFPIDGLTNVVYAPIARPRYCRSGYARTL